jgi:(hydroxyamino)benzene mutase
MEMSTQANQQAKWLLFLGVLLFLFGLIIGLLIPVLTNQRMGLTAHLEGVMNGMFLVLLGLLWNKVSVNNNWLTAAFWLMLYSSFANFIAVTLAAITGAGKMMPIAGGKEGAPGIEGIISFLLISLALAALAACSIVLSGLYKTIKQSA